MSDVAATAARERTAALLNSAGQGKVELDRFSRFTATVTAVAGKSGTFLVAVMVVAGWAIAGPFCNYSESWQLAINTTTTIITFLMVFVIQNSQYRETAAIQLKLAELIRAHRSAENALLDIESLPQEELEKLRGRFEEIARTAREGEKEVEEIADR